MSSRFGSSRPLTVPPEIAKLIAERVRELAVDVASEATLSGRSEILSVASSCYLQGMRDAVPAFDHLMGRLEAPVLP